MLPTSQLLWWDLSIMKNIDIKSLIIGALLTSTIFLGVAATSVDDKWDKRQVWVVGSKQSATGKIPEGWEPVGLDKDGDWGIRKRIK